MSTSKIRWLFVGLIVFAAMTYAMTDFGFYGYVQSWGGVNFKLLNGAALGWFVVRYVIGLDISALPPEQRPLAGLSLAIVIGFFGHALATGA